MVSLAPDLINNLMTEYKRNCPECNKEIIYKAKQSYNIAIKENRLCRSCSKKGDRNVMKRPEVLEKFVAENNPMYGKTLYDHWLSKYGKDEADRKYVEHAKKSVVHNNVWRNSVYDIWVKKYGKEKADQLRIEKFNKASASLSGKNNPMYGKPAPIGTGSGWSGWFRGIFFRSILELSYLKYLIDNEIKFESGELLKHRIDIGDKSYFPDFYLTETEEVIEVKPKVLINTAINKKKFAAARQIHGSKFKVLSEGDIIKLTDEEIKILHDSGELVFTKKYEEKFISY